MPNFAGGLMHRTTNLQKARRFRFLRAVFWLGLTAFGGPQMHLPYFKKTLVDRLRFISQEELIEINAFCSALPGPSTTQTITTIGLKLGGISLAIQTLILWALPGALIMTALALSPKFLGANELQFMGAAVLGFMAYGTWSMYKWIEKTHLHLAIFWGFGLLGFVILSPWFFPISMLIAGYLGAKWGKASIKAPKLPTAAIKWRNLSVFIGIFLIVGISGMAISRYEKESKWLKPVVLFENTYRMSSLSLGGGHVLAAMTLDQYVTHSKRITKNELNSGIGMVQAIPGPNFNLATYVNAISLKNSGFDINFQILGALIGLVAVFLPGTLFVFFAFPIWEQIKSVAFLQRSIPAIFALSVGFILTATLSIGEGVWQQFYDSKQLHQYLHLGVLVFTVIALATKKIPSPFIVLLALLVGWIFP